jgi:hypothetical protein
MNKKLNYGMYGMKFNEDPEVYAGLRDRGVIHLESSIYSNDLKTISDKGFEIYYVFGAFLRGEEFTGSDYLAEDIDGKKHIWFSSACPNRDDIRKKSIDKVTAVLKNDYIDGVIVDGARYSSLCSSDTIDSFFTCFCPVCTGKTRKSGYDYYRMKNHVQEFKNVFLGNGREDVVEVMLNKNFCRKDLFDVLPGVYDWLEYKKVNINEYLKELSNAIKGFNKHFGIYAFTPSLSWLVGQEYSDNMTDTDFISPMIYRRYKGKPGPACLNTEVAAIVRCLRHGLYINDQKALEVCGRLLDMDLSGYNSAEEIEDEMRTDVVYSEVKKARNMIGNTIGLNPIIQLDDPKIKDTTKLAQEAGADLVDYFYYDHDLIDFLDGDKR